MIEEQKNMGFMSNFKEQVKKQEVLDVFSIVKRFEAEGYAVNSVELYQDGSAYGVILEDFPTYSLSYKDESDVLNAIAKVSLHKMIDKNRELQKEVEEPIEIEKYKNVLLTVQEKVENDCKKLIAENEEYTFTKEQLLPIYAVETSIESFFEMLKNNFNLPIYENEEEENFELDGVEIANRRKFSTKKIVRVINKYKAEQAQKRALEGFELGDYTNKLLTKQGLPVELFTNSAAPSEIYHVLNDNIKRYEKVHYQVKEKLYPVDTFNVLFYERGDN